MLCPTCSEKTKTLRLLEQAIADCDEAEEKYRVDLADERAELEALRAAVEASQAA